MGDGTVEQETVRPLSPSQIDSIMTCGERFRLERIVKAPQRESWPSIAGNAIHSATEALDKLRFEQTGT